LFGAKVKLFKLQIQALKRKKLFILDYHDLLMPYVEKVRDVEGTTLYGSRTLFFLTENGTLRPLAIELTRPPIGDKPQWKEVFTPTSDATGNWLWRIAKAHVCAHDGGYHELVIHWYAIGTPKWLKSFFIVPVSYQVFSFKYYSFLMPPAQPYI
jgi:hypothetical protein